MLIQSQDGRKIINLNSTIGIEIKEYTAETSFDNPFGYSNNFDQSIKTIYSIECISEWGVILGKYSTEKEAMKILNKIFIEFGVGEKTVFIMPKDEEVEVNNDK